MQGYTPGVKKPVLLGFAFVLFLASSALCLGGLLEHICQACPEKDSCGHEESCIEDPCGEMALVPAGLQGNHGPEGAGFASHAPIPGIPSVFPSTGTISPPTPFEAPVRLPMHTSDLPLLI
jgi:hypothetical protein